MPRVILRTVAPAKVEACQSVEKRCTRKNASPTISCMTRELERLNSAKTLKRSAATPTASAKMESTARAAAVMPPPTSASASMSRPAKIGMVASPTVASSMSSAIASTRTSCRRQCCQQKPKTRRKCRTVNREFMCTRAPRSALPWR